MVEMTTEMNNMKEDTEAEKEDVTETRIEIWRRGKWNGRDKEMSRLTLRMPTSSNGEYK
jgi:hypothetical protein